PDVASVRADKEGLVEQRGALKQSIDELGASARVADAAEQVETLQAQRREARLELAEIELASHWLKQAWDRYVRETQPAVLRRASDLLARATEGSMVAVREHERTLFVESASGRSREPGALSRGSREMLYLVLRLALALEHAGSTALPLLLDDVLVNQDPERADQLARILASVGEGHQVIVLTCRPETRDRLRAASPEANVVELARTVAAG
ncbi:MAG: hypothetical protein AAF602_22670, partial [Myxococcota bacterium]